MYGTRSTVDCDNNLRLSGSTDGDSTANHQSATVGTVGAEHKLAIYSMSSDQSGLLNTA